MIDLNCISDFFPPQIAANPNCRKYMLKEYIQLMILERLSATQYMSKLAFIGGTNLRLIKGIDRFSEDLDFDCKSLSEEEFKGMTDGIITYLQRSGLHAEAREKDGPRLTAFRRNIYFPEFLFELGLTGHRDERFLLKMEAQDQGVDYPIEMKHVQRCGFFFSLPAPSDSVLLSMKLSALLSRAKGRDFYDTMFLMQMTAPSYDFLEQRVGIRTVAELKDALSQKIDTTDLNVKKRDFEHLLFDPHAARRILNFPSVIEHLG